MLPARSIDLVVTDPPYGVTSLAWDTAVMEWPRLLRPLLAPHASLWCFGSLRSFLTLSDAGAFAGWALAQDLIWEKRNGGLAPAGWGGVGPVPREWHHAGDGEAAWGTGDRDRV